MTRGSTHNFQIIALGIERQAGNILSFLLMDEGEELTRFIYNVVV